MKRRDLGLRPGAKVDQTTHVVETVGRRYDVISVGKDDVTVTAPPSHVADLPAIDREPSGGTQQLHADNRR